MAPDVGLTARLNSVVPTPENESVTCSDVASIANTSWSGSWNRVVADQSRPRASRHAPLASALSITPTRGAAMPAWLVAGPGCEPGTGEPPTVHGVVLPICALHGSA